MPVEMVLSIVARDRPGLVETLAKVVDEHSGSWIDSSMARLGGEFAGILRAELPENAVAAFEQALAGLKSQDITVIARRAIALAAPAGSHATLELTGMDHPGIIHEISSALARRGVSIDELHTQVFAGSMTGGQLFEAQATVVLPEGLSAEDLRFELERIATDIMVEISLRQADDS